MSWQLACFLILGAVLIGGFAWYERSRPTSQIVALVAVLAALAIAGRVALAPIPNVVATTDVVLFAGYALGAAPGFAVGALAGLISNFWLGQGPWTPWQMAGWGMCGIFGAILALGVRNAGRFTLAAACGLAAVAYGALLNFSLMATYGGELSLERFLVLESRAIPFELAHAIGNVVLALVAGPAMVGMLVRFRRRFEWRTPAIASALLAALALATVLPARAEAADTGRAVSWLTSVQNFDGGWGPSIDRESSVDTTAWVMLGLEAAGRNPLDMARVGHTPVDFLRSHVDELSSAGDFARTILALEGAGVNPRSFGGHDLVEALLKRRRANGSYEGWPSSTAFAALALRAAGAGGGLDTTFSWLAKVQNRDGGWGDVPGSLSTADGTGAVMQAMPDSKPARDGLDYLRRAQRSNGGFVTGGTGSVNAQSTAWAVQGTIALGTDPGSIREGGKSGPDYLAARQAADGHYSYSATSDQTPIWVTGQVLAAVAGKSFPVPVPPRRAKPSAPAQDESAGIGAGSLAQPPSTGVSPEVPPAVPPESPSEVAPLPGGEVPPSGVPPTGGVPPASGAPVAPGVEGAEPETPAAPAAAPFVASENPSPEPWAPLGIALGTGSIALGSVLLLGRRFGW